MRPMTQNSHLDLSGEWSFAYSDESHHFRTIADIEASGLPIYSCTVPGNFELDLLALGLIDEPFYGMNIAGLRRYEGTHVWYFRRFTAGAKPGYISELVFEGIDCFAEISVDGNRIDSVGTAYANNMLIPHTFWINHSLTEEARDHELVVHILPTLQYARPSEYSLSPRDYPPGVAAMANCYESLYVRKAPHMYGWDIMPRALSTGLWRPVSLRYKPVEHIEQVFLRTKSVDVKRRTARLNLHYDTRLNMSASDTFEIEISGNCGESTFVKRNPMLFIAGQMGISVDGAQFWWPKERGAANLYAISVALYKNGAEIDRNEFSFGIRTVELLRTSVTDTAGSGEFCFKINGEKVFIKGSNWVPADAYHSRDVERIPRMLELADEIGCNLLRCWGGNVYENDLFFDLCDQKGIMIWQDFAMACAVYPQNLQFQSALRKEAVQVVRRLRNHACLILWAGDNECDQAYAWHGKGDPNANVLTRKVLPEVLRAEDPSRPYLPSSPYIDPVAYAAGEEFLTETHLWGPRDYYKSDYYKNSLCHFASEMGYHGCPSPESIRKFISPEKMWPYTDNEEWILHSTSPIPGVNLHDYRVELMAKQVHTLFGTIPDNLEDFSFASQVSQAEAKKFFVESFRAVKWRRTGLIWWNLIDGWPQFSDAVVDYYFEKKLAFDFIKRAQEPVILILREPENMGQELVVNNDTRTDMLLEYTVTDIDTGEIMAEGRAIALADSVMVLSTLPYSPNWQRFYLLEWRGADCGGKSHYLLGAPPFDLAAYRGWLRKAEFE